MRHFAGRDGLPLAYRELGSGRPVVLIHGYFSTAQINWIRYGHAATIAARGYRVVMPDLRGHGASSCTHDPAAYPPDVLADDALCLIEHLGLDDYDLGGYSLGGRTTVRMLVRGAQPRRAVIAGTGLEGIVATAASSRHFRNILVNRGSFMRGTPEWDAAAFLKTAGADPAALLNVLDSFVDTPIDALRRIRTPTLVLMGADDLDHGSAAALSAALPQSIYQTVPGTHMSAVVKPDLGVAIADFLERAALEGHS